MDNKNTPNIKTFDRIIPMIYAYNTPGIPKHDGWTKIGYTEKQTVEDRINQQTHTADVDWILCWKDNAMYKDGSGEYFTDHDFHAYLEVEQLVERTPKTEWFRIDGDTSRKYFDRFASRELSVDHQHKSEYSLRDEQRQAVEMTKAYFDNGGRSFFGTLNRVLERH